MLVLAILPAVVLMTYVYRKDTIEKEPLGLLLVLFLLGALASIPIVVGEMLFESVVLSGLYEGSLLYIILENFLGVALVEELGKYFVLKSRTWKSAHFNFLFDAIVYAVVASLGFATLENVLYLMDGSISTAIGRAILSVPGHAIDGVFMGCYYGLAKRDERMGNARGVKTNLRLALLVPVLVHGTYDFFISTGWLLLFFAFEIVVTAAAVARVRRVSKEDAPV